MRRLVFWTVLFLAGVAVGIWLYDERPRQAAMAATEAPVWEPLTAEGADRARSAVQRLSRPSGPVFATVRGAELASYVFDELSRQLPPSAQQLEAAVIDDRLHVRALMNVGDFGGDNGLGPLGAMLNDREPVEFGGTLELVRPGLAQFRIKVLRLREFSVPQRMIPRLLQRVARGARPPGLADDALPLVVPTYLGDVRTGQGRVTLYKVAPR